MLRKHILRELGSFIGYDPKLLIRLRQRIVHMKPSGIHRVPDHVPDRLRSPDLGRIGILFIQVIGCTKRSVSLVDDQVKHFPHDRSLYLVNFQIVQLTVFLAGPAVQHQLVAIGGNAAPPQSVRGHLRMRSLDPHGGLFAFAAGLPETDVVDQLVTAILNFLLAFPGAPDFDAVIDEPLHQEGSLVFTPSETVEHKDQQYVKFLLFGQGTDVQDRVPVFGGYLISRYAFFHPLVVKCPVFLSGNEVHAFTALHGDIVGVPVNLPFGRYSVQTKHSFHAHCFSFS